MKRYSSAPVLSSAGPPPTSAGVENILYDVAPVPAAQVATTYEAMESANTHTAKKKPEMIKDDEAPLTAAQIAALYDEVDDATKKPPATSSNQDLPLEQTSQIWQTSVAWQQPSTGLPARIIFLVYTKGVPLGVAYQQNVL